MVQPVTDSSHWFVVERQGTIKRFDQNLTVVSALDLTSQVDSVDNQELGLLGLVFHPNFPTDPRAFVFYSTTAAGPLQSRLSVFRTSDGGVTLDKSSEQILLTVNKPYGNHNGGNLLFGPDGYLYLGLGDGGGGYDPNGNGQSLKTLLGKMLRIDVGAASATTYSIPASNPYSGNALCNAGTGTASCPEIYSYGMRNPWRWSFDKSTGDLWVGDVGQDTYEEVDRITMGGDYGWVCREGAHPTPTINQTNCTGTYIDPVVEYTHNLGVAVTGGYVYRGTQSTALVGSYIFGDYSNGSVWAYTPGQPGTVALASGDALLVSGLNISSFAQGNDGELYALDFAAGGIYKLNFQTVTGGTDVPDNLADTGCAGSDPTQPSSGMIPYNINAAFWSDGATKSRWFGVPDNQTIAIDSSGDWNFPVGSVLRKDFSINGQLFETRLLMHHTGGEWAGYTYQWNSNQTAATRVRGGKRVTLSNGQDWLYPSESQCLQCHTTAAGRSLGPTTAQMNKSITYPSTNRTANELDTLSAIGTLSPPVASATSSVLTDPTNTSATLTARARAYLDSNCSQCHRPGGPTPSNMDLRATTSLVNTNACNIAPSAGSVGITNAKIIAPGDAASSVLIKRANSRDVNGMPPLGSLMVDTQGVQLLTDWVNSLSSTACN